MKPKNFDADIIIIGFTGPIGSGCTTIAKTVADNHKYEYYSLSKCLYELADEKGIDKTRESLQDLGNQMRKEHGHHYLAKKVIERIDEDCEKQSIEKVVLDSIRNDKEVKYLRQFPNFYLISAYADWEERFNRLSSLDSTYSKHKFREDDLRDATEIFPHGQQVEKCTYLSDIIINNPDTSEIDHEKTKATYVNNKLKPYLELIESGPSSQIRPGTNEKLMTLAYLESLSSSCIQRKVGAVIATKEGDIISSAFNDVPPNEESCLDKYGECYRKYMNKEYSKQIKHCPSCGESVEIRCNNCQEEIDVYTRKCPYCGAKINDSCTNCKREIFEIFTPAGKKAIGKLLDVCRSLHAEENAILRVAKVGGRSLKKTTLYCTTFPCNLCANKISEVGINKIVYSESYPMEEAKKILRAKKVTIEKFEGVKSCAFFKLYGY